MSRGMNRMRGVVVALATLSFAASLCAQSGPPPRRGPGGPGGPGGGIGVVEFERGGGGRDFSPDGPAVTVTFTDTSTQTLTGGTTIQHQSTGTFARDGQGDTYEQETFAAIGPWAASGKPPQVIFITNRAAGLRYVLNPGNMSGTSSPIRTPNPNAANRPPRNPPNNGGNGAQVVPCSPLSLTINGYLFQGTCETRTIPANQIGNSSPLQTIFNRWYDSTDKLTGETQRIDPRFGTTTFLVNSVQSGANPDLFTVPGGYNITAAKAGPRGPKGGPPPQ